VAYSIRWANGGSVCHGAVVARRISCFIVRVFRLSNSPAYTVYRLFLASIDITLERFHQTSHICGYTPRQCLGAAVSPDSLRRATQAITTAIKNIKELSDTLASVQGGETVHRAFQIRPSPESRGWNSYLTEPVSVWAFSQMMTDLDRRSMDAAYTFYLPSKGPLIFLLSLT
jgi:hypothetical protein